VNLFAKVRSTGSHDGNANFRGFFTAISTLVRSMTGEGWNEIMHSLSKDQFFFESILDQTCAPMNIKSGDFHLYDKDNDDVVDEEFITECGDGGFAVAFFMSYTVVVSFVILNLFIAVIFEGFEESSSREDIEIIARCVDVWRKYDHDMCMLLPVEKAFDFIDEVVEQLFDFREHFRTEPRWDRTSYSGGANDADGVMKWAMYNLRYIRLTSLVVTDDDHVRFIVAVKAVIRCVVVQGGLRDEKGKSRNERIMRSKELEDLDAGKVTDEFVAKELGKRKAEERRQARHFNRLLGTNISVRQAQFSSERAGEEHDSRVEHLLIERVALAKIAREVHKLRDRRITRKERHSKITQVQHVEAPVGQSPAPQDENLDPLFVPAASAPLPPPESAPAGLIVVDASDADSVRLVPDPAG